MHDKVYNRPGTESNVGILLCALCHTPSPPER